MLTFQHQQQQQSQPSATPASTTTDPQSATVAQTLRLRDNPAPVVPNPRPSRKRKSPPSNPTADAAQAKASQPPPPPVSTPIHPPLQQQAPPVALPPPPPHALVHPPPHMQGPPISLPPGYQYAPADYTPGGLPPPHMAPHPPPPSSAEQLQNPDSPPSNSSIGRALSSSKRAEQNRKAQRAFRERRDQHVKALESRSQLLDAALASADEANRRWEECRALVDQLRIENAALRASISQAQMLSQVSAQSAVEDATAAAENASADKQ